MDRNFVNKAEIENNNKNIEFYIDDEYKTLTHLNKAFLSMKSAYKSDNNNYVVSRMESFEKIIEDIKNKRYSYLSVLNSVVDKYVLISANVNKKFEEE